MTPRRDGSGRCRIVGFSICPRYLGAAVLDHKSSPSLRPTRILRHAEGRAEQVRLRAWAERLIVKSESKLVALIADADAAVPLGHDDLIALALEDDGSALNWRAVPSLFASELARRDVGLEPREERRRLVPIVGRRGPMLEAFRLRAPETFTHKLPHLPVGRTSIAARRVRDAAAAGYEDRSADCSMP